ncbi:hypothetical protein I79_008896 [Cricetulus griseus]|uniref:Uncharacterized protein n=1 Tax=Cricetulus griseus TaxID=10029 RepID=G3HEB5_CRIGR|nr:hypothetical protein I79_008896 [Cricetulus griseus]
MTSSGRRKSPAFENTTLTAGEHHNMKCYSRALPTATSDLSVASGHCVAPRNNTRLCR